MKVTIKDCRKGKMCVNLIHQTYLTNLTAICAHHYSCTEHETGMICKILKKVYPEYTKDFYKIKDFFQKQGEWGQVSLLHTPS